MSISQLEIPSDPVKEYIKKDIETILGSTDISKAAKIMTENNYEQLTVLRGKHLVGLLKDRDLLNSIRELP